MPSQPISFGILLYPVQALDIVGPMDILTNVTPDNVEQYGPLLPNADLSAMLRNALDLSFHYPAASLSPVTLTGNFTATPTCTYDECPKFDYLLIGGPDPKDTIEPGRLPPGLQEFIRAKAPECKTIFTTCSGALTLASTGLLDGLTATVNHALLSVASEAFPGVHWVQEKNWVEGEKYWTASGAVAGMDMMLHWLRTEGGVDLVDLTTMLLDFQPRDLDSKPIPYVNGSGKRVG